MRVSAHAPYVHAIRENWLSGNPLRMDAALQAWTALASTGASWDFKVEIRKHRPFVETTPNVILGNHQLNYDAVANIHYGFVGRVVGFRPTFIVFSAGVAQAVDAINSGNPDDWGACNLKNFCDHPFATWSIQFGIYLYERCQGNTDLLTPAFFTQALEEYIQKTGTPPPPPPGTSVLPPPSPSENT